VNRSAPSVNAPRGGCLDNSHGPRQNRAALIFYQHRRGQKLGVVSIQIDIRADVSNPARQVTIEIEKADAETLGQDSADCALPAPPGPINRISSILLM
jgi:hypothetical protein